MTFLVASLHGSETVNALFVIRIVSYFLEDFKMLLQRVRSFDFTAVTVQWGLFWRSLKSSLVLVIIFIY